MLRACAKSRRSVTIGQVLSNELKTFNIFAFSNFMVATSYMFDIHKVNITALTTSGSFVESAVY
uniref:Uncharacterized protein n=1 Tax=Helianthus annuus TaxID=4232 RepID=A0A251SY01_HELAN